MKTISTASAVALGAALVMTGACMVTANPAENTSEDGGTHGAREKTKSDGGTGRDEVPNETANVTPPPPAEGETLATFSVPEVLNIAEVIQLGEMVQAELAKTKATNADVKAFADRMIADHAKAEQRIQQLQGTRASIEEEQTRLLSDPTAKILIHHDELLTNDLKAQRTEDFDMAYMTGQIMAHAAALALIDRSLLPSAQAPQPTEGATPGATPPPSSTPGATPPPGASTQGGSQGATRGGSQGTTTAQANDVVNELKTLRGDVAKHLVEALRVQKTLRTSTTTPPPAQAGKS
jgi:putative membrane protein